MDNGFTAQAVGNNSVYVTPGQSVTFEVEASCEEGDLTYSWARYSQIQGQGTGSSWKWTDIPGETGPKYTITADGTANAYRCSVSDKFGSSQTLQFRILLCDTNAALPLTLDTDATANVDYPGKFVLFSFTPQASGSYVFYSQWDDDSYGYLFDGNMIEIAYNDDEGEDSNFRIECELQAGTQYYFGARCYSVGDTGSIPVRLEKMS